MQNWSLRHIQFGGARLSYDSAATNWFPTWPSPWTCDDARESRPGPFSNLKLCAHKLSSYLNVSFIKRRLAFDRWSIALVLTNRLCGAYLMRLSNNNHAGDSFEWWNSGPFRESASWDRVFPRTFSVDAFGNEHPDWFHRNPPRTSE